MSDNEPSTTTEVKTTPDTTPKSLSKNGKPLGRPKGIPELARKPGKVFNTERKRKFLKALSETGSVSKACSAVGISRMTAYQHRQKHNAFAERWELALAKATASFEELYHDRVREGDEVTEYDSDGNVTKRTIKKAAKPVESVLKTLDPDKYAPKSNSNVNVNVQTGDSAINKLAEMLKIKLPQKSEKELNKEIEGQWEEL